MPTWPVNYQEQLSGVGCPICAEGRPDETDGRIRFFSSACSDGYLHLRGVQHGYAAVIWRGRHVAEPVELSDVEASAFWFDLLQVGRAMQIVYRPLKMNYQLLGNRIPHFIQNDLPGMRPLSRARVAVRQAELSSMFAYIKQQVPAARSVLGNSWMYNLEAYRRLYPQVYTQTMAVSTAEEFQFLALWGQCFDSRWQVRTDIAEELLRRVDALTNLADLRGCFPYQILQPHGAIDAFYAFYQGA